MKSGIYTIYDEAADEYGPVFTAKNDAVAQRQFNQLMKTVEYPAEFELYKVGDFDSENYEMPLSVCVPEEVYNGLKVEKEIIDNE